MNWREWKSTIKGFFGRGTYPHQLSFVLGSALRRLVLSPGELAGRLHLDATSRVLEVGPGPGYFSVEVARRIPQGRLELIDLQREMLEKARRRLQAAGACNAGFTQGDARTLPFAGMTFDVAFLVAVLGEVPDPAACLRGIHRVLRPGGLLSITEQPGDPDALPLPTVRGLAERAGFEFVESFGRGKNYTANFRKPGTDDASP
ncbi:MAG: class I SAM-dependent methyltransferase [Chloroflexi bacterium]|nr:class I SAM-dependent methyltransferase [Chloroflexota bacterium]